MLENFPAYLLPQTGKFDSIFEELCEYKFKKRSVYSARVIRFALLLQYTSIQSYRIFQKDIPLPSMPLLRKICSGAIDAVKCAQTLKNKWKISEDVCLLFNGMYLQKCEEYFGGDLIGCGEDGNVYKGLVCLMIIALKESVPYVIKSLPQAKISADWLKNEVSECLDVLIKCSFNTRAIICDNYWSKVSAFKKLLECSNQDHDSIFMLHESRKLYLSFDTVYLIKNVRNNLLNHKRFLFPSFTFNGFKDSIKVTSGMDFKLISIYKNTTVPCMHHWLKICLRKAMNLF